VSWDAIGALAELVGAAAVVATLAFLVVQMRQNTRALDENSLQSRVSVLDRNYQDLARWREMLIRDDAIAQLWIRGCKGEDLSTSEAERFVHLANELIFGLWRGFEGAKSVGDEGYIEQIRSISAVFASHPTLRGRIEIFAKDALFADFAREALSAVGERPPDEATGAGLYERMRSVGSS